MRFPVGVQEQVLDQLDGTAKRTEVLPDRVLLYTDDADGTTAEVHARGLEPETIVERRRSLGKKPVQPAGMAGPDHSNTQRAS